MPCVWRRGRPWYGTPVVPGDGVPAEMLFFGQISTVKNRKFFGTPANYYWGDTERVDGRGSNSLRTSQAS